MTAGQRTINWVWYDPDLTEIFEATGCVQDGIVKRSLLPHELDAAHIAQLAAQTKRHWPEPWRSVVLATIAAKRVFATPIAEYVPKRLTRGRLALSGDAAHVVVPATGAGLFTGLDEVEALGCAIEAERRGGPSALETYERERLGLHDNWGKAAGTGAVATWTEARRKPPAEPNAYLNQRVSLWRRSARKAAFECSAFLPAFPKASARNAASRA